MAIVNPLLAAWDTTGVVRMFEYTGGAFVQNGSLGGFTHTFADDTVGAMEYPFLHWLGADTACAIIYANTANEASITTLTAGAAVIGTDSFGNSAGRGSMRANALKRTGILFTSNKVANSGQVAKINGAGVPTATAAASISVNNQKVRESSPSGAFLLIALVNGTFYLSELISSVDATPPVFEARTAPTFTIACDLAKWAYDDKTVVIADKGASRVQSWSYDDATDEWSFIQELTPPAGVPQALAMSADKRKMALSTLDGSTYRTRIFRRTGSYFVAEQDFDGIGWLLDFTEDGVLLLDCANKTALRKQADESFLADNPVLVNVPTGIRSQGVSAGRTDAYGTPFLYDDAVADFADKTVDLANLKLTLLTSSASFDSTDTTLSAATNAGAWELSSGGWPAGGVLLENVVDASGIGFFALSCDPITRILIETGVTFRYAVVYDATSGVPLIFIDLVDDRAFAKNREISISFRDGEFLRFSK